MPKSLERAREDLRHGGSWRARDAAVVAIGVTGLVEIVFGEVDRLAGR